MKLPFILLVIFLIFCFFFLIRIVLLKTRKLSLQKNTPNQPPKE